MLRSSLRVARKALSSNGAVACASYNRSLPIVSSALLRRGAFARSVAVRSGSDLAGRRSERARTTFASSVRDFFSAGAKGGEKEAKEGKGEEEPVEAEATGEEAAEEATGEGAEGEGANEEVENLKAEVTEKTAQVKDLNDKLLRTLADMENLRERTRRQAENAEKFAIQGFCKDLLDVADNLGRAAATVDADAIAAESDGEKLKKMLTSLHEGVLMVEKQLGSTFGKHGVEKYDPAGEDFDPNAHMALFNVPDAEKTAGTIASVTKAGYKLHDRVIRPAEVGVYQSP